MADEAATLLRLDGVVRLFAYVGDPIAQVSPRTMTSLSCAANPDALMVPLHVGRDDFAVTMPALMAMKNFYGAILTYPFKAVASLLVNRLLPAGKMVGAINAMRREPDGSWVGEMFDGKGLAAGLVNDGIQIAGRRILLVGAGAAGSAVAFAFAELGVAAITLFDIDQAKADAVVAAIGSVFPACEVKAGPATTTGQHMLINATPVEMAPQDGMPAEFDAFAPSLIVVDIVPKLDTPLMVGARRRGCRTIDYRAMANGQMAEMAQFFGVRKLN